MENLHHVTFRHYSKEGRSTKKEAVVDLSDKDV